MLGKMLRDNEGVTFKIFGKGAGGGEGGEDGGEEGGEEGGD